MTDFGSIDALLASARQEVQLPPVEERRSLREGLNLSRAQVAGVLGVSPSTVGGWEAGRDPSGEVREKYAYFLQGAQAKLHAQNNEEATAAADAHLPEQAPTEQVPIEQAPIEQAPTEEAPTEQGTADAGRTGVEPDDVDTLSSPQPCVLCGQPAHHEVAGFPQHLDMAGCAAAGTQAPASAVNPPAAGASRPAALPRPAPTASSGERSAPRRGAPPVKVVPVGRRVQTASDMPDLIGRAVAEAFAKQGGDIEAVTAALIKRAIPDAMILLDETRKGARYDIIGHPWIPDILRKKTAKGADEIWEARPKWTRPELPPGRHEITALDINGAYLSALKTHLPIGQLEHSAGPGHDRRRAGVHLITPPAWEHEDVLPNPTGNRDEPGPLWVTEPTLRLLLRLAGPRYGLCEAPVIHESYTSGATENLLEKFRNTLKDARNKAITEDDEVTLEYVKAMYSKFVSTMGESNYNRELYRPDWMHLIRSQAFANLWMKAYKAHDEGLIVVRAMGTDELHVIGDWQSVFPEGRGVTEVKVKDTYTAGTGIDPAAAGDSDEAGEE
ncbi:helix-turn-helix domain-containing protein [Streptomyces sp. NBC_01142]|uniref:helix-turn-helix domain-containing protein n=1 Tax=Streptomyces sp. NBC_01142 TaxID=2975865 RepID=UPI00224D204C|nr:helix-turn-helix domain-containing protein [Streptomyces sp. NBC_01142]MCX4821192.1 helix-turn-helix domain-containing protein [Streptomyces sp. NBC_01142]